MALPVFLPVLGRDQPQFPSGRPGLRETGKKGFHRLFQLDQPGPKSLIPGQEPPDPRVFPSSLRIQLNGSLTGFLPEDRRAGLDQFRGYCNCYLNPGGIFVHAFKGFMEFDSGMIVVYCIEMKP